MSNKTIAMMTCTSHMKNNPLLRHEDTPKDEASYTVSLSAEYRPIEERTPEEAIYGKFTPTADIHLNLIGAVADNFKVGQKYLITFEEYSEEA